MAVKIQKIKYISVNEILPNPYQLRRNFVQNELFELADSIKKNGILSPLIVRKTKNGYELISGQRRLRAATIAGIKEVPVFIVKAGDAQCAELSVIENIHRKNLTEYEEAEGFYNLISYHKVKKDELSSVTSKKTSYINEKIRILMLNEKIRRILEKKNISCETAKELLKIHDEEKQMEALDEIIRKNNKQENETKVIIKKKKEYKKQMFEKTHRMPVFVNTINKTVELLQKNGAEVEITQNENEKYSEFVIKIIKN